MKAFILLGQLTALSINPSRHPGVDKEAHAIETAHDSLDIRLSCGIDERSLSIKIASAFRV